MAFNTQFSIAVHMMAALGCQAPEGITSEKLASSVNTSPSFVRRTLAKLSKAGLVVTARGKTGACRLARDSKGISLLEIYQAVESPRVFAIHHYPTQQPCQVSCHIKTALDKVLTDTQRATEKALGGFTLAGIISEIQGACQGMSAGESRDPIHANQ